MTPRSALSSPRPDPAICPCRGGRIPLAGLLLLLLSSLLTNGTAQVVRDGRPPAGPTPSTTLPIRQFLEVAQSIRDQTKTPGAALAIVVDRKLVHLSGLGVRDVQQKLPATPDTLFAIGSCTKAMTAAVAIQLAGTGTVSLDDPVAGQVDGVRFGHPYLTESITLKDLLTHNTGLGSYNLVWYGARRTELDIFDAIPHLEPYFSLRKRYAYNNLLFSVAGRAVARIAGSTWEDQIRRRILEPLKMRSSVATYAEFLAHDQRAKGYDADGTTELPHLDIDIVAPAGAVGSTARDMAQWLLTMLGASDTPERVLTADQRRFLISPHVVVRPEQDRFYGLGWDIQQRKGLRTVGHGGGIVGQNCYVHMVPDRGFGIVLLANQQSDFDDLLVRYAEDLFVHGALERDTEAEARLVRSREASVLARQLAANRDATLRIQATDPCRHPTKQYAGRYVHPAFSPIVIQHDAEASSLRVTYNGFSGHLHHEGGERFRALLIRANSRPQIALEFELDQRGRIVAVAANLERDVPAARFRTASLPGQLPAIDQIVTTAMERFGIPGAAVAVLDQGKVVHRGFYGQADASTRQPVTPTTSFRIYSLTKLFVATAVFQCIEKGQLALEDPIHKFLDDIPDRWRALQIRHLLTHSAGLPPLRDLYHLPEHEAQAVVYQRDIVSPPGARYTYSLTGFWLLQRILEKVTGEPFQQHLLKQQFPDRAGRTPLFSANLRVPVPGSARVAFPFALPFDQAYDYLDASNGLLLTLDEFIGWSQRLRAGNFLTSATKKAMWSPFDYGQPKAFAHGWDIHTTNEMTSYGFSGSMVTAYRHAPDRDLAVVFLGSGFEEFFNIEQLMDQLCAAGR